jgi:UDP-glucose 4-epimerase
MTWQTEIVRIVRFLINDVDGSTYDDSRLEETAVVAAQLINSSIDFDTTYTVTVSTVEISPDPTSVNDDNFINLVALKTACIILKSEAKTYASQSYKIVDGPSTIETSQAFSAAKAISDQICEDLSRAIMQFQAGNSRAGAAILTPYTQTQIGTGIYRAFN